MILVTPSRPLTVGTWMLRDIAGGCGGAGPHARMLRSDLAFIGAPQLANRYELDHADPAWGPIRAAFDRLLTDRSADAAARILEHVRAEPDMDGTGYDAILVDPITRGIADTFGNSVAGLVMMTRGHEDMVLQPAGYEGDGSDQLVTIDIVDVEYEGAVHPFLTIAVELAEGIMWEAGRLEIPLGIPETVGAALAGRRLADFISHPLLDPHDARIRHWDGISLHLDFDGQATSAFA